MEEELIEKCTCAKCSIEWVPSPAYAAERPPSIERTFSFEELKNIKNNNPNLHLRTSLGEAMQCWACNEPGTATIYPEFIDPKEETSSPATTNRQPSSSLEDNVRIHTATSPSQRLL